MSIEQTLVLVKPDGVRRALVGEIIRRIEAKGYEIKISEQMKLFYKYKEELISKYF